MEETVVSYSAKVSFSFPEAIVGYYTLPLCCITQSVTKIELLCGSYGYLGNRVE